MISIAATALFFLGYFLIAIEHKIKTSKSAIALVMGILLWLLVPFYNPGHFQDGLTEAGSEIFSIVVFLLAAMSLVEILVHYRFFDILRGKLFALGLTEKKQFLVITVITFFLSAVVDNLTCTIVMVQIATKFFKGINLLRAISTIVISANAGGAFSPIGDVTTIMLWLAGKFSAWEVISKGFFPSLTMIAVPLLMLYPKVRNTEDDVKSEIITTIGRSEKLIIASVFASFGLPLLFHQMHLPPYFGLLLGLGTIWIMIDVFKQLRPKPTHLEAEIEKFIKNTDIPSLKFFIGILLAVSALNELHILQSISSLLYGSQASELRIIAGNIGMGLISAILDNVPLTAVAIDILPAASSSLWVLLALCVGTGGSLLVIGSAAGVIAMGIVKELNFTNYFKIAFLPAISGFFAGLGVWAFQYFVLGF